MSYDILLIPITTIALKSAFSAGSKVINTYRASLGVDTTQVLLCGGAWLLAFYGIKSKKKVIFKLRIVYRCIIYSYDYTIIMHLTLCILVFEGQRRHCGGGITLSIICTT